MEGFTTLELKQIDEYETFQDLGPASYLNGKVVNASEGYKKLRVHLVFDVKHDGRHKSRLVDDGHVTGEPIESVYSSVVSLRSLRIVSFLNELNNLELWGADIGNAYLEARTKEKLYIIAGKEFGEREGHVLVIQRALYGLKSSGKRWHERFSDCMRELGFNPCKADPDIWMRKAKDEPCYEYVAAVYDRMLWQSCAIPWLSQTYCSEVAYDLLQKMNCEPIEIVIAILVLGSFWWNFSFSDPFLYVDRV